MQKILILVIKAYSFLLSPFLGPCCRFSPTCSAYAEQAIKKHGVIKGGYMSIRRVCRCHPFHAGGYDPVS